MNMRKAYRPAFKHDAMVPLTPIIGKITMDTLDTLYNECNNKNNPHVDDNGFITGTKLCKLINSSFI